MIIILLIIGFVIAVSEIEINSTEDLIIIGLGVLSLILLYGFFARLFPNATKIFSGSTKGTSNESTIEEKTPEYVYDDKNNVCYVSKEVNGIPYVRKEDGSHSVLRQTSPGWYVDSEGNSYNE